MEEDNKNIKLPFFGIPKILPYVKKYYKKMILMTFMVCQRHQRMQSVKVCSTIVGT